MCSLEQTNYNLEKNLLFSNFLNILNNINVFALFRFNHIIMRWSR